VTIAICRTLREHMIAVMLLDKTATFRSAS